MSLSLNVKANELLRNLGPHAASVQRTGPFSPFRKVRTMIYSLTCSQGL